MSTTALVIGAGPAGLSAATSLADWCSSVTVLEAGARHSRRAAGEHLPPAGLAELAAMGCSGLLDEAPHEASPGVRSAWGAPGYADKEYFFAPAGKGLNLRREAFDEALARRAEARGATLLFGTRLQRLQAEAGGYRAFSCGPEGQQQWQADVVVDATGRGAMAARQLGAVRRRCDELMALVGRFDRCRADDEPGRIRVEAAASGWWYGVPFADGSLLACFMTDAACLRSHPQKARGLWLSSLQASRLMAPLANSGQWRGQLQVFDAATQWLQDEPRTGFVAVGDAAAAYDPLSSWGITKGLADGHAAALALAGERAGDALAMRRLRERRRRDFEQFRLRQAQFYSAERRWAASPFWQVRQPGRQLAISKG